MQLPGHIQRWEIGVEATGDHEHLPFTGWIVRGALGRALRGLECRRGCGTGACQAPAACGYARKFEHPGVPYFRVDSSELDGRSLRAGDRYHLRLVTFAGGDGGAFALALAQAAREGLGMNAAGGRVLGVRGGETPDVEEAARRHGKRILVELRTPAELAWEGGWNDAPEPVDVLDAVRHRAELLGLPVTDWEPYEREVRWLPAWTSPWEGRRWSARRKAWVDLRGVRAGFKVLPTPAQGRWFALGEVLGVGAGTAFGQGVLRVLPEPRSVRAGG
jgi:hypothetical protein